MEFGAGFGNVEKCERDLFSPKSHRHIVLAGGCVRGGGGIHTFMPGGFCDVNVLSVQPSPFGAC